MALKQPALGTAATILVIDRSPQGAEHVKRILIGSILTVGPAEHTQRLLTALDAVLGELLISEGATRP